MFDMRPYRNNNDRRNNLSAYNPFREMDAFDTRTRSFMKP